MTSCARYADLDFAERYVLGQMDEAEQASFEAHYFECPDCFAAVQALQAAQGILRESAPETAAAREELAKSATSADSPRVVDFGAHSARAKSAQPAQQAANAAGRDSANLSGASLSGAADQPARRSAGLPGAAWIGLAAAASLAGLLVWAPWRQSPAPGPAPDTTVAQQRPPVTPDVGTPKGTQTPPVQPNTGAASRPSGTGTGSGAVSRPTPAPAPGRPLINLDALALVMPPPYVPLQTRGEGGQGDGFAAAMARYAAKDYRGAAAGLQPIADAQPDAVHAQFFLGISYLALDQPANASAVLNKVAGSGVSPFADEAHFYLAKAALRARDLDRAERELTLAAERQAGPPGDAQKLLQALRTYRHEHGQD
jgi:hypothetical protein